MKWRPEPKPFATRWMTLPWTREVDGRDVSQPLGRFSLKQNHFGH